MRLKLMLFSVVLILVATGGRVAYGQASTNADAAVFEPNALLNEGIELGKRKKFDRAREKFEQALVYWQVHPTAALYLKILADVESRVIKKKVAEEIFKRLKENVDGKHEKALKEITKVAKKNKSYFPAYLVQSDLLARSSDNQKIEESLNKAVEVAQDSPLALIYRGKFYAKTAERGGAVADFTAAIARDPSSAISHFERGFVFVLQEKYEEAIADFERAGSSYPEWQTSAVVNEAYHNRGVKRIRLKAYRKAVADFDEAIRINPEYLNAYLNRGVAYRNLKQYSKAISDFTHCIAQKPKFTDALYNRALTHYDRRHYQKAVDDLVQAVALEPNNDKMHFKLAESYYNLNQYKDAVLHFDKVIGLDAGYYWAYYWKGFSHGYLRQREPAILAFQRFLELAPKSYYKQIAHAEVEIKKLGGRVP